MAQVDRLKEEISRLVMLFLFKVCDQRNSGTFK